MSQGAERLHHSSLTHCFSIVQRILAIAGLLGFLTTSTALAQHHPGIVYGDPEVIAPGVSYYTAREASRPWEIRVLEVDLSTRNVRLVPAVPSGGAALATLSNIVSGTNAVAAINAGFFWEGGTVSHVAIEGKLLATNPAHRNPRTTFGVSGNHHQHLVQTRVGAANAPIDGNPNWSSVLNAIGGGPQLVRDGVIEVLDTEEEFTSIAGANPRTALGFNSTTRVVYLVTVDGRQAGWSSGMTFTQLAGLMIDLGCDTAMNYDGGGSTMMWVKEKGIVNRPSDGRERAISTAWLVMPSHVVDDTDDEFSASDEWMQGATGRDAYNKGFRAFEGADEDAQPAGWMAQLAVNGIYELSAWWPTLDTIQRVVDNIDAQIVGTWPQSANSGFYGSDSLYSPAGEGSASVTWQAPLPSAGSYRVFAWWVAANNRTPAAQYSVHHTDGVSLAPMDQRSNGSQWNLLGTWNFDTTGRVVLTNESPAETYVSADAIRFERVAASAAATYEVYHAGGVTPVTVNQGVGGGGWNTLGQFTIGAHPPARVRLIPPAMAGGAVFADAFQWTLLEELSSAFPTDGWILF